LRLPRAAIASGRMSSATISKTFGRFSAAPPLALQAATQPASNRNINFRIVIAPVLGARAAWHHSQTPTCHVTTVSYSPHSKSGVSAMPSDRPLAGKRILTFVGDLYEDLELWYPKLRLMEAGAAVVVAGEKAEAKYAGKNGYPCVADAAIARMRSADFDGLVVPGGFMPDRLRRD